MKKIFKLIFAASVFGMTMTCCDDFGDTNVDPEHLNQNNVPMEMVFSNAQHQALGSDWDVWRNGMIYLSQWNQHVAAGGWWWSYGINSFSNGYASSYWASVLGSGNRGAIRDIQTVIKAWKDDPDHSADYQIARIVRAYIFHRVTDLHGDIPYFQAGQGNDFLYPEYDTQEAVYADLLKELEEAQAALDGGKAPVGSQDLYYGGDLSKWKKFANSLLLRVAMRLSKVDPATARSYVAKAYANGVITQTVDNAQLGHSGGSTSNDSSEPYAKIISHEDVGVAFINETLMDVLSSTKDPRIPLIMALYPDNYETKDDLTTDVANCAPSLQKGLKGFFSTSPSSDYSFKKYYPKEFTDEVLSDATSDKYYKKTYSQINRATYGDPEAPTFICTAAQTNLLLAEASHRGWISGDAGSFYEAGVRCAMEQFSSYPSTTAAALVNKYLTSDAIDAYLAANPYDGTLKQINTQYWITCMMDEYETYANWRRSGYPELKEKCSAHDNWSNIGNYPKDGNFTDAIVRRFPYPSDELQINPQNYKAALSRLGLDNESDFNNTRVWWDIR